MRKIKETLIHWLGGYTAEDTQDSFNRGWRFGRRFQVEAIKEYADGLYGLSAEEWCEKMYECLTELNKE